MISREDRLAAFKNEIQKSAGKEHFQLASDMPKLPPMIPTGCLEFDSMLGGGFAAGAVHMLWGEEAGGKTTTALHAVASLHRKCASCYAFIEPRPVLPPEDNKAGRLTRSRPSMRRVLQVTQMWRSGLRCVFASSGL